MLTNALEKLDNPQRTVQNLLLMELKIIENKSKNRTLKS